MVRARNALRAIVKSTRADRVGAHRCVHAPLASTADTARLFTLQKNYGSFLHIQVEQMACSMAAC